MIQLFSGRRRQERSEAEYAYYNVLEASRRPLLYSRLGAPDNVDGRFDMLVIHMFACLSPLMKRDEQSARLAETMSEVFVTDMDSSLRDLGVSDTKVAKRMRTLYGAFSGRMSAYDEAAKDSPNALSEAIDRNLFPEEPNGETADFLARYVLKCLVQFPNQPLVVFQSGKLNWPDLELKRG